MPTSIAELGDIESYYDTVPRASATVEEHGPFTLFVSMVGFPYYARPRNDSRLPVTVADVTAVRARQRELGVPEAFEWVDDLQPELSGVVRAAGLVVYPLPLMACRRTVQVVPPVGLTLRVIPADDPLLPQVQAAIGLGFSAPGTAVGPIGAADRATTERDAADQHGASVHRSTRERIAAGLHVLVGAFDAAGAVAGGSHSPRGSVTEITGVATLPSHRRRGIGAAVTGLLVTEARQRGVRTCFLSAGSDDVARVYQRAGFERIGTACIAGAPS